MTSAVVPGKSPAKTPKPGPEPPSRARAARLADLGLIACFLALTFLLGAFPLKDTDFWWHLKAGDQIRQTWKVPTVDTFTYGAEGHPWTDLHWGFQVLISWGYALGGVPALTLAKCAITTLAVFLLITARKKNWPVWAMLMAWLPAILVLGGRMYIRPETLTLLYMAADLAILSRWDRRPALAFLLPVVQLLWVNSHGLFVFGPILIAFALLSAAFRRGAFEADRRTWWRKAMAGSGLAGLACLANPYGLGGALYPLQLAETMRNPIFKKSIMELRPLPDLIEEIGFDNLVLDLHLLVMLLGALSFLIPMVWSAWAAIRDRAARSTEEPARIARKKRAKKTTTPLDDEPTTAWRLSPFRLLLYASFSLLSLSASRNSHQFAAIVGTVTAWNVGEWVAAIRGRQIWLGAPQTRPRAWPRWLTFVAIASTFAAVASGKFYEWSGEGRTIGLGEEPLWFPHDAVKLAGSPGMPDRLIAYHNGHPSLYEYEFAPARKAYTDARLEVMGVDLYEHYLDLEKRMADNSGGWADEVAGMGRPAILLDNLQLGSSSQLAATLLTSGRWRCVWFDAVAGVYVHDSYADVIKKHGIDFLDRHFHPLPMSDDEPTLGITARSYRNVVDSIRVKAPGSPADRALTFVGLDHARRLRELDPGQIDGWKQAGLLDAFRDPILSEKPIPRFRLPFDPVLDLNPVRASFELTRALEIDPADAISLRTLGIIDSLRGLDEAALPLYERFARGKNTGKRQQVEKAKKAEEASALAKKLGPIPDLKWANLGELDRLVSGLLATGRAETAAEVIDGAFRAEARPWEWSDRLAVLRLHLGQPARARLAWMGGLATDHADLRAARVAASQFVEGNLDAARMSYREAIRLNPTLFEAHYGLALLEQDAGRAPEALAAARTAEKLAPNPYAQAAARTIADTAKAYARP